MIMFRRLRHGLLLALVTVTSNAHALSISAHYDSSITGSAQASQIENAIQQAIGAFEGIFTNAVTLNVNFSFTAAGAGNLLSTTQSYYDVTYSSYVAKLQADAAAHPGNTVLSTALANLQYGNDANGTKHLALSGGLVQMLYGGPTAAATININSAQNFSFTQPTSSSQYDLVGGLEHELDEVLGGGGGGSMLNFLGANSSYYGAMDLYRYSGTHTASFTTSSSASSYFSVDGGVTKIVDFNQSSGGDFGDFGPACNSDASGQLIQNAFNCKGHYEAYTSTGLEATMLQAIGWDTRSVPEPASYASLGVGLAALVVSRRRRG